MSETKEIYDKFFEAYDYILDAEEVVEAKIWETLKKTDRFYHWCIKNHMLENGTCELVSKHKALYVFFEFDDNGDIEYSIVTRSKGRVDFSKAQDAIKYLGDFLKNE